MSTTTAAVAATAAPAKPLGMRKNGMAVILRYPSVTCLAWATRLLHPAVLSIFFSCLTKAGLLGKQWHETKKAFRPGSGVTSYEKRAKQRVEMAAVKAKEKEMKDEKEAERQVRENIPCPFVGRRAVRKTNTSLIPIEENPGDSRQASREGGEGAI